MVPPFCEQDRRPTFFESVEHVIDDELVSRLVSDERPIVRGLSERIRVLLGVTDPTTAVSTAAPAYADAGPPAAAGLIKTNSGKYLR